MLNKFHFYNNWHEIAPQNILYANRKKQGGFVNVYLNPSKRIGQTLPHFDKGLDNLKAGDSFEFDITAENAYGVSNDEFIVTIPRDVFSGPNVPQDIVQVGNMVPMQDQNGNPMNGVILSFTDESVEIDFNHPLADEALNFKGNIVSVREALAEELSHGHVHGAGGHDH